MIMFLLVTTLRAPNISFVKVGVKTNGRSETHRATWKYSQRFTSDDDGSGSFRGSLSNTTEGCWNTWLAVFSFDLH